MTAIVYPREFASDSLFASGASVGADTKVDPTAGAEAQGAVAGLPFAAAHHNFSVNKLSLVSRWAVEQALLTLVPLFPEDAAEIGSEAFDGLGVVIVNEDEDTILVKGGPNGIWKEANGRVSAWGVSAGGAVSPCGVAGPNDDGELATIDETNGRVCVSTDAGVSWNSGFPGTAHTSPGIAYDSVSDLFVWTDGDAAGQVYSWAGGVAPAAARATTSTLLPKGVAVNSSGRFLVLLDNGGLPAFDSSTNGTVYATTGGTPPGMGDFGSICCNGTLFFWAGADAGGADISVQTSTLGAAWAEVGTISPPGGVLSPRSCQIVCEPSSGILWIAVQSLDGWRLYVSPDSGATWIGPRFLGASRPNLTVADKYLYVGIEGSPMLRTPQRLA
jgi:hypothetical protein